MVKFINHLNLLFNYLDEFELPNKLKSNKNKKIFLFGTPMHGNLGDHAIAIQEQYFFEDFKFLFYVHDKKNLSKQKILSNTYFSFMKCFPYVRYR